MRASCETAPNRRLPVDCSTKYAKRAPAGTDLGKIVITLDDGIDLPNNGPKLNVREGSDTLTITIVSNGK